MAAPVIGIVGGIGSGKSLVAAEFARHGGLVVAGDRLGHDALRQPDIKAQIVGRWGKRILDPAAEIDRRQLAGIVFADRSELRALESMTHPYIGRRIRREIANAENTANVHWIVLDAALLLEAGWHEVCSHIVFVDAPDAVRAQRLQERGWSARDVKAREQAQMPLQEKRQRADAVIDNSAGPEQITAQVEKLLAQWH